MPQTITFFTFFPLYISYGLQLVHSENNKNNKSPFIFFNNCISAQVIHYSLKPCLCNLTSEMLAIKACTCNNEKKKHFILLLNKMCMNLKNAHLSLCLLRGPWDSHHPAVNCTGGGTAPTCAVRILVDLASDQVREVC